jgi:hypothetical protein
MFNLPHFLVFSSFIAYRRICNQRNMTGAISGTGTAYPFGIHGFVPGFSGARVARSLVLCVVGFFLSLFVRFLLTIVLSVDLRILITPLVSSNSSYILIFPYKINFNWKKKFQDICEYIFQRWTYLFKYSKSTAYMYILSITRVHLTRIDTGTFKYTHSKINYLVLNTIKQTNKHMCTFPL